jgi:hypothetical protein
MERVQAEISLDVVVHELPEQMRELSDLQLAAVGGGIADTIGA